MRSKLIMGLALGVFMGLPACSTIDRELTDHMRVDTVPLGTPVAGIAPGSHAVAGRPDLLKRIPSGGRVVAGGMLTLGAGAIVDVALGANKNLSPNPVTVYLARSTDSTAIAANAP